MKKWILITVSVLIAVIVLGAVGVYAAMGGFSELLTPEAAVVELESLLHKTVDGNDALRNGVLLVDAPALGVEGAWAAGVADVRDGSKMTADTPFLSASIGKLFTAATVLSLAEAGVLSLDDSVTDWLEPEVYSGIPAVGGDAALQEVTIRRLLGQRSGIPDYYEGETVDGAPNVLELLITEPDRVWTPQSLLEYTKVHYAPAGAPGEVFVYSDTNYDLLGMIVEEATELPFHAAVAERVLQPLALQNTWYHARTDPPRPDLGPYADVWMSDTNLARVPALSLDWAGGGLATTVGDLRVLMRALLAGRPVALDAFRQEWTENSLARAIDYGYGLWRIRPAGLFFLLRGYPDLYGASGSTGAFLYYVPEYDAVIAGSFNQTDYVQGHVQFLLRALGLLGRIE